MHRLFISVPDAPDTGAFTLVHSRRNWPTDPQRLVLLECLTEVLQHGRAQALATVSPPDEHGVKDGQQVAHTHTVTTQAACREARGMHCPLGLC